MRVKQVAREHKKGHHKRATVATRCQVRSLPAQAGVTALDCSPVYACRRCSPTSVCESQHISTRTGFYTEPDFDPRNAQLELPLLG